MRDVLLLFFCIFSLFAGLVATYYGMAVLSNYPFPLTASYFALLGFAVNRALKFLDRMDAKQPIQFRLNKLLLLSIGFGAGLASISFEYKRELLPREIDYLQATFSREPKIFGGIGDAKISYAHYRYVGIPFRVEYREFWFDKPLSTGGTSAGYPPNPEDPEFARGANFFWFLLLAYALSELIERRQDQKREDALTSRAPSHTSTDPTVPPASSVL